MANIHSTITYNANLSAAQAQIKALTTQIGALTAAFNTLDKSALTAQRSLAATFAAGVGQAGGFTTQTVKATSAVETFGKQLAANRLTMRQYFREAITGYTRENSLMRRLAEQQVRYQQSIAVPVGGGQAMMMTPQNINAASNAAALASQRFSVFNQLMNGGATAMLNWGKNTQWAGRQLMVGFTVPLMLFTAVASKQFRELDKELTRFQKVYGSDLGNAISESTGRMREQVKQLAFDISSTYGIAAKETAALAADIAATGAEGEKLLAGVQQTTRLAVLGEVDRQEAMKATLSLQSAFRMNTNELAESINFLNAVENQTSATLQDLSTAIPKVGPVVRSLGGDIKDLATLLVAMREGGIPAAEAANALKSGLASLINPTKQASAVAKSFGVDLVGIVEANRGQLMPTIYAMKDALAGLDSFSRSRIIEQIFGKYQFARITALFDNIGRAGSQTQSVVELASKSSTELASVANQELKILTESTAVKFQRTLENLKNAIMPIGQTLTETLIPIFEFIGKGISTFSSFFQAIPEPIKNFAKYSVAIAALAGPIIMLVGLFGNLIANGLKFGMMLTRIGARIAGIKTEKFELLTADVMAAKLGVDRLTTSFDTQEKALMRLTGVLSSYEASLRRLTQSNPALFIPGAVPRGGAPIRRQKGSTAPEKVPGGYGGGDTIPALLEPGEFVMTKEAVSKYAPVLTQMNRGTLPGFVEGLDERYYGTAGRTSTPGALRGRIGSPDVAEDVRSRMNILLDEMIESGRLPQLSASQRMDLLGPSLSHVQSEYEGGRKVWRQNNLFLAPQAENNALEQLFGKNRSLQRPLMVSAIIAKYGDSPEFREIFGTPRRLEGNIKIDERTSVPRYDIDSDNVKHPRTASQIRYMSRVMSELFSPGATQLLLAEKSKRIWGPVLAAVLSEKLASIEGRSVNGRNPLFGLPQLLSEQRTLGQLGPPLQPRPAAGSVPPSMARPVGPGPRPIIMTPRGPMGVMPRELIVPPSRYADNGAIIDPDGSVKPLPANSSLLDRLAARAGRTPSPGPQYLGMPGMSITAGRQNFTGPVDGAMDSANQNRSMMRGQSMMNLAFGLSMAGSGIAMLGGQSSEAANKLMIFTTALSVGIMTLQAMQGFGVGGKLVGGVKAVGRGVQGVGGALGRVGGGAGIIGRFGGLLGAGGGALAGGGTAAALAVGGVAAAVTAVGVSLYLYKKSLNDVRDRAMAAFQDPVKTVEFFGKSIENVNETLKGFQVSQFSKDLDGVNDQLQEAVKQDYAGLIGKIQTSTVGVGASNLAEAYNQMLISGLTAEEALESIKAIAVESGTAGGAAYAKAFGDGLLNSEDPEQAFNKLIDSIDPNSEFFQKRQASLQTEIDALRAQGNPIVPIGSTGYYRGGATAGYNSTTLDQMGSIQEELGVSGAAVFSAIKASMQMIDTNPELVAESAAKIRDAYLSLSTEGGGLFGIGESDQELAYDSFKNMMGELNDPQINKIMDSLQNATPEAQALAMELVSVGGSLIDAAGNSDVFNESLARAAVENVKRLRQLEEAIVDAKEELSAISEDPEMQRLIDLEEEALEKLIDQQERFGKKRERLREEQQDSFEESQDAIENEIELLTDQQDAIDKTTDAYINSLEKKSEAESFYSQQRKTSLGALEKLASGDVFGFLQERESLSAAAQDFSIDQQIQDIEERRDLEIEALQDQVDKKEELMQLNQEAHEIAMENFDKETQKQAEALQEQVDRQRTHVGDMNQFQDQIAQGQIVSYARIREAFGDHLAEQYKMEFDQLMRSTAASLSAQVSLGRITAKEAENELLQLHRGFFPIISGTPGSVQGAPFSYSDLASIYTLPTVLGGRNPQSPGAGYYSPGNDTGSSAAGSTPAQPPAEYAGDYWPNEQNPTHQWNPNGGPNRKGAYQLIPTAYAPGLANGGPIKLGDGSGGKVTGPGGPKSDVIPAYLSNGEYVIQASSVSKYGKDMMDNINAGKFAYGGYISADRAETAAAGNKYLGGVKVKPQYTGGTPMSATGYSGASQQAYGNVYGKKRLRREQNNPYTRGGYMQPGAGGGGRAGSGFNLMFQGMKNSIDQQGIFSTLGSMVSSIAADPASLLPFYGLSSIDQSNQQGKDIASAAALMEILGLIPLAGAGFKAASLLGRSSGRAAARTAAATTDISTLKPNLLAPGPWLYRKPPTPIGPLPADNSISFSLGMGLNRSAIKPIVSSPTANPNLVIPKGLEPRGAILDFVRKNISEENLDEFFGEAQGRPSGVNPGGFIVGKDGVRRYIKGSDSGYAGATYTEALVARIYDALGIEVPKVNLLSLGDKPRMYDPGNQRFYVDPSYFSPNSLVMASKAIPDMKHLPDIKDIPPMFLNKSMLEDHMKVLLSEEGGIGRAMDIWLGLSDTHLFNYGVKNTSFKPFRLDVGSNAFSSAVGGSKIFDPTDPLKGTTRGIGFAPLSETDMLRQTNLLWNIIQKDFGGVEGVVKPITDEFARTAPTYLPRDPNFIRTVLEARLAALLDNPKQFGMANGGLVQKFANGGPVQMKKALDKWAGPKLKYHGGWSSAGSWGKPYPGGILMHHTSAPATDAQVDAFRDGYGGYDGPIVQSVISRDGTGHIIGYGNRNIGAGPGTTQYMGGDPTHTGPQKDLDVMKGIIDAAGSANAALFQMEVISEGVKQDFTAAQFDTIAKISSGLREWMGWPTFSGRIINHKDWAGYRSENVKGDTLYPRSVFEKNAANIWNKGDAAGPGRDRKKDGGGSRNDPSSQETYSLPSRGLRGILSEITSKSRDGIKDKPKRDSGNDTADSSYATTALDNAKKQIGDPYKIPSNPPDSWDCSTLTAWAWNQAVGKSILTPYSHTQATQLSKRVVGLRNGRIDGLSIGDVLYFHTEGDSGGHTSMYAGGNQIIQASQPGTNVMLSPLNSSWNIGKVTSGPYAGEDRFQLAGPPKGFAAGGFISGPGGPRSDMIPAMLSNGEYVVKASSVAKYGKGFMDQVNSGSLNPFQGSSLEPRMFASGGMVGSAPMPAFSMPEMADTSIGVNNTNYAGNSSSTRNNTKVQVVINGSGGKSANAIANKVISMINSANNRRNHSRSI